MTAINRLFLVGCFSLLALSARAASPAVETVLILGDSLSAGYGVPEGQGWVDLLSRHWQEKQLKVQLINASVSGATTAAGLQRLPNLLRIHNPNWLILELGGNDGLQGKPINHIRANLQKMIDMAQSRRIQVYLVGMRIPPNLGKRYTEPFFSMFAELAQSNNIHYTPFLLDQVAGNPKLMLNDGIHPNTEGQALVYQSMRDVLTKWVLIESATLEPAPSE